MRFFGKKKHLFKIIFIDVFTYSSSLLQYSKGNKIEEMVPKSGLVLQNLNDRTIEKFV